ncbi:MAG TPA: HEAT repeat domain-containing protein [Thermoanaerobaculia bacterium]
MPPLDSTPGHEPNDDLPKESARTILFQFVLFPLGVVAIGVAIFLLFGKLAGNEQSIPDYLTEIRSGGSHERWQAAYQLSKAIKRGEAKQYPQLVPQVAKLFSDAVNDDPRVRQYLAMVLGNLGDKRATPVLVAALTDKHLDTRIYALLALGQLHDPAAAPPLQNALQNGEKDERKAAAYALGELGQPGAAEALAAALNDPEADVRYNAALSMARFGDGRSIGVLREMLDRSRLDRVQGMRPDQKEDAMLAAIPAYVRVAGAEGAPTLQALSQSDPSMQVRSAAKEALGNR